MKRLFRLIRFFYYRMIFKEFGWGSYISKPMFIGHPENIRIEAGSFIWPNARLEAVVKYAGKVYAPCLVIEKNVSIQQNFHCTCAGEVRIGEGTSITQNVGIFDIIHPYTDIHVNPRDQGIIVKNVMIGRNCLIGMNSVILPGTILGNHCIIGANSVVSGHFDDYCVLAGTPAKVIKRFNLDTQKWDKITIKEDIGNE